MPFSRSSSRSAAIISWFISFPLRAPLEDRSGARDVRIWDAQLSARGCDHDRFRVGRDQRALVDRAALHGHPRLHLHLPPDAPLEVPGLAERPLQAWRADLE